MGLQPVANNPTAAGAARGCHGVDCALKAIKCHRATVHGNLKGFVVIVAARIADRHENSPLALTPTVARSLATDIRLAEVKRRR